MRTRIALTFLIALTTAMVVRADDPLPSWNDTAHKNAIIEFVERVTKEGSPDFVKPEERIATFDNDGTLWAQQPIYFQVLRPQIGCRQARQSMGRSDRERLDRGEHERRLENNFS
jgi:hypothetical protein